MKNMKRWALALGIAAAGVLGGAGGVAATTAGDVPLDQGYELASHEDDDGTGDQVGVGEKDESDKKGDGGNSGGDSSDKSDDDSSDVGDTDGPGDDEDD